MSRPSRDAFFAALEGTWPAARTVDLAGWRIREGRAGGSRVSAATAVQGAPDIQSMEAAQAAFGQPPLVMIRPGEQDLDARLAAAGYGLRDPVHILAAPTAPLAVAPPPVTAFHVAWPPAEIQREIWQEGGIGPGRWAVMERVAGPRVALLGRSDDRAAGTGFAALHGDIAMVHALEVARPFRRRGVARHLMQAAALWAQARGAGWVSVLVTKDNAPAIALYESLGFLAMEEYHYRQKQMRGDASGLRGGQG